MDAIESALEEIRPALDSDGFDLRLGEVEAGGRIRIVLEARPDACHECLVPDDVLLSILESSIREHEPDAGEIVLEKQGF